MQQPTRIVGAGFSGLLAAYAWPGIPITELAPVPRQVHRAVLRFRGDAVSRLTGIPFRKVRVHKGIWFEGKFHPPTISLGNAYSLKTLHGFYPDRSIWNIEAADRYIAPEDFYDRLIAHAGSRIAWGTQDDLSNGPVISTIPLTNMHRLLPVASLKRAAIKVDRFRVCRNSCDLFQTVYFPSAKLSVYRATITGDLLTLERDADFELPTMLDYDAVRLAFGINIERDCDAVDRASQEFGKIVPLSAEDRKRILFSLTHDHGIYSLGRFATWRNILLDDVVNDIAVIQRLLRSAASYDAARARAS